MGALDRSPKSNWVEKAGGLPDYIERIAQHLHEQGIPISRAIAVAVNTVKRWARGGTTREGGGQNVSPATQVKAAAALAQWEAMKTKSKVTNLSEACMGTRVDLGAAWREVARRRRAAQTVDLAGRWKHGYIPLDATAMRIKAKGNAKTTALYNKRYGSLADAAKAEKSKRNGDTPGRRTSSPDAAEISRMSDKDRASWIKQAKQNYGEGSRQHKAAVEKYGAKPPALTKGQAPGKMAPMTNTPDFAKVQDARRFNGFGSKSHRDAVAKHGSDADKKALQEHDSKGNAAGAKPKGADNNEKRRKLTDAISAAEDSGDGAAFRKAMAARDQHDREVKVASTREQALRVSAQKEAKSAAVNSPAEKSKQRAAEAATPAMMARATVRRDPNGYEVRVPDGGSTEHVFYKSNNDGEWRLQGSSTYGNSHGFQGRPSEAVITDSVLRGKLDQAMMRHNANAGAWRSPSRPAGSGGSPKAPRR